MQIRRPEPFRIELSGGTWIDVIKHLSAGNHQEIQSAMYKTVVAGERPTLDPEKVARAQTVVYLLDWNVQGVDGRIIPIRDQPYAFKDAAVAQLDPEDFDELKAAVSAHDAAMTKEREAEKNARAGAPTSSAPFASVA